MRPGCCCLPGDTAVQNALSSDIFSSIRHCCWAVWHTWGKQPNISYYLSVALASTYSYKQEGLLPQTHHASAFMSHKMLSCLVFAECVLLWPCKNFPVMIDHHLKFICCFSYHMHTCRRSQKFGMLGPCPFGMGHGWPLRNTPISHILQCQI